MAQVIASLKATGIAARDLSTSNVSLQPQYRYAENQPPVVTGYQATNGVSVRFREIAKAAQDHGTSIRIGVNAGSMQSGAQEISSAAEDLSRRTEQQAASLEETAAALDQITATVRKTAENAQAADGVVTQVLVSRGGTLSVGSVNGTEHVWDLLPRNTQW